MSAKKKVPASTTGYRLSVRLSDEEHRQLTELRLALHQASDGQTIRSLIKLHHVSMKRAVRDLRRQLIKNPDLRATLDPRQLRLFTQGES